MDKQPKRKQSRRTQGEPGNLDSLLTQLEELENAYGNDISQSTAVETSAEEKSANELMQASPATTDVSSPRRVSTRRKAPTPTITIPETRDNSVSARTANSEPRSARRRPTGEYTRTSARLTQRPSLDFQDYAKHSLDYALTEFISQIASFRFNTFVTQEEQIFPSYEEEDFVDMSNFASLSSMIPRAMSDSNSLKVFKPERYLEEKDRLHECSNEVETLQQKLSLEIKVKETYENILKLNKDNDGESIDALAKLAISNSKIRSLTKELWVKVEELIISERMILGHLCGTMRWKIQDQDKMISNVPTLKNKITFKESKSPVEEGKRSPPTRAVSERHSRQSSHDIISPTHGKRNSEGRRGKALGDLASAADINKLRLDYAICQAELNTTLEDLTVYKERDAKKTAELEDSKAKLVSKDREIANLSFQLEKARNLLEIAKAGGKISNAAFEEVLQNGAAVENHENDLQQGSAIKDLLEKLGLIQNKMTSYLTKPKTSFDITVFENAVSDILSSATDSDKLNQLNTECDDLRSKVLKCEDEIQALLNQIKSVEEFANSNGSLRQVINQVLEKLGELKKSMREKDNSSKSDKEMIDKQVLELFALKQSRKEWESKHNDAQKAATAAQESIKKISKELEQALKSKDEESAKLKKQMDQMTKDHNNALSKLKNDKDTSFGVLNSKNATFAATIAQLEAKLLEKDKEMEKTTIELKKAAEQELSRVEMMLFDLKSTRAGLLEQLDNAEHEIEELRLELSKKQ